MDRELNYTYDAKFEGHILVVGRTGCGKTTFVQNLGKNRLFGDIKEVYWVSKIEPSTDRAHKIRDCFRGQNVDFKYPADVNEFDDLLEIYQRKKKIMKIIWEKIWCWIGLLLWMTFLALLTDLRNSLIF